MKLLFYKSIILITLFTTTLIAQKEVIYKKSYDVNKNTTLYLDLKNTTVGVEHSTDGKVHFDYSLEFKNYSKKEIKEIVNGVKIESAKIENSIKLNANSITKVNKVEYSFDNKIQLVYTPEALSNSKKTDKIEYRKSKDSLLSEIKDKGLSSLKRLLKNFKTKSKNGEKRKINTKNVMVKKSMFVIKVPPFVKIKIKGNSSQITLLDDFYSETKVDLDGGFLRSKSLENKLNQITIKNAVFEAEKISGKLYKLNNVSKCLIGEAQNTTLESEFSRIEIGEVHQNVIITDFNSEFFFYNFVPNFHKKFFSGEYSKIHFHEPQLSYTLKVFGNNTVFHLGDMETKSGPKKDDTKSLMLTIKRRPEKKSSGNIDFDLVHGIMYVNLIPDKE